MSDLPPIPQTAPGRTYEQHAEAFDEAIARVMASGNYILGDEVAAFEREFASYLGDGVAVGVANGTDALELALRAVGVGPGDAVFTVAHTAVATVSAIERTGGRAVLVDVDASFTMDPQALEAALSDPLPSGLAPKAVVPVHLYGHPADLPALAALAADRGLALVEDCAQAHGAVAEGRAVGLWGAAASFSFYPTKNLGAFGDGGMVVTRDGAIAERVRELRQYGWRSRYISAVAGFNSRLDEVHAATLRVGLRHLDEHNRRRQEVAGRYDRALAGMPLVLPSTSRSVTHVYHQYVIRSSERDAMRASLVADGIGTAIHYPVPVHLQPAYESSLISRRLTMTEAMAGDILSLPMFPTMTDQEVDRVTQAVGQAVGAR